ncbi:MAG: transcription antitermination factor NusB, partial [Prolixibacteraceae bacterium]|nr:transcription antitermination factor NusB [Prolixibacteraceae bacterium]
MLQSLYTYYSLPEKSINNSEKELLFSIGKTYDLYNLVFLLIIELADYMQNRIDNNREKMVPSYEDLHPNTKFVDNNVIRQLRINRRLAAYTNKNKLSWANHPVLIKELYLFLNEMPFFGDYMKNAERSYAEDKKLIERILENVLLISEEFHVMLEEDSIYWNDDLDVVISMVVKTLKNFTEDSHENQSLL